MKISIVIPTYNCSALLAASLRAMERQTLPRRQFEVIVCDDGSSDDTEQVASRFASALSLQYLWQPDQGFRAATARNQGVAAANGDIILFLDSGVLLAETGLAAHCRRHAARPRQIVIGYVYGYMAQTLHTEWGGPSPDPDWPSRVDPERVEASIAALRAMRVADVREGRYLRHGDDLSDWPVPFDVFWTCHVSLERAHFHEAGGFDDDFRQWGGEDFDLAIRLFNSPDSHWTLDRECRSIHLPHQEEVASNAQREQRVADTLRRLAARYPQPQLLAYLDCLAANSKPLDVNAYLPRPARAAPVESALC